MLHTKVLNQNKDFRRLYYRGESKVHPFVVTYIKKNKLGYNRIGITTSKKIGKAYERNRAKRIIREVYRLNEENFPIGLDMVFVARSKTTKIKMNDLEKVIVSHMKQLTCK